MLRLQLAPFDGPILVRFNFFLTPPTSLTRKKRALGPCRKPDLDKLIRSTADGMTEAGVWTDDARIVFFLASKAYCNASNPSPGAMIRVIANGDALELLAQAGVNVEAKDGL